MHFSIWPKKLRKDTIEAKAQKMANNLVDDLNNFTETEQASIVKRVNHIFLERFTEKYNAAYEEQQMILEAKEILK